MSADVDVVTGAFGYIGRYIAEHLLETGRPIRTITTHVDKPNPFGSKVAVYPYSFDQPRRLTEALRDADTLYNTYWIRFEHDGLTFQQAVDNTRILFDCAVKAGVRKIVHISVTNASVDSVLPYYAGKGRQEQSLMETGLEYAIVRPTLVFGRKDILMNNIAWLIRRFPLFPIMGDGRYKMQPIFAQDLARIAVEAAGMDGSRIIDALGPETYTYFEFVKTIASAIGRDVTFVRVSPRVGLFLGNLVGLFVRDVILTQDEFSGLASNLLTSPQSPNGNTAFSKWIRENSKIVGTAYASELDRHFRWKAVD